MRKLFGLIGAAIGGWLGWWLGAHIGIMAAYMIGMVGTGAGLYAGYKTATYYLP